MTTDDATPKFDPTWLRGQPVAKWADMFGIPQDVNDAEDEGEPQRDTVLARLIAERDRARATAVQLEQELATLINALTEPPTQEETS